MWYFLSPLLQSLLSRAYISLTTLININTLMKSPSVRVSFSMWIANMRVFISFFNLILIFLPRLSNSVWTHFQNIFFRVIIKKYIVVLKRRSSQLYYCPEYQAVLEKLLSPDWEIFWLTRALIEHWFNGEHCVFVKPLLHENISKSGKMHFTC